MKQKRKTGFRAFMLVMVLAITFAGYSCMDNDKLLEVQTYQMKVQLKYPEGYAPAEGVSVKLTNTITSAISCLFTDTAGAAMFEVVAGVYELSASETRTVGPDMMVFNGIKSNLIVTDDWNVAGTENVSLSASKSGWLIIKELYNGGCQKDDGSGTFQNDQYVILYNNSSQPASLENLAFGYLLPNNSQATNNYYINGSLYYEAEGWLPAGWAIWSFRENVTLDPGQQIVVAIQGAINNTLTYSNSINFDNAAYYAMYDKDVFSMASNYPTPAEAIVPSHYLKAHKFQGYAGTGWSLSTTGPAFIIFKTEGVTPKEFADNVANAVPNLAANLPGRKVPVEWVVDGMEVYTKGNAANKKRLTPTIDNSYVELTNQRGFTLYRNVDKEATEAIAENAGKIVYGYSLGTVGVIVNNIDVNGTTDPSGIDAEASIKNGARIIYKDTNNSSNDFHQRSRASLRD